MSLAKWKGLTIGDAVEVSRMQCDGYAATEQWIPATVCHVSAQQLGVAFSDGERRAFSRAQSNLLRKPLA